MRLLRVPSMPHPPGKLPESQASASVLRSFFFHARRPGVFEVNNIPVHFQPWEEGMNH